MTAAVHVPVVTTRICLPDVFLSLRYLKIHRFTPRDMDGGWNPMRTFQTLLPLSKKLEVFALEPDDPHIRGNVNPLGYSS
ncbi:hypothetical protein B0H13DRAFT_2353758 [Mycena leptocephala]|nr:hypothetical protein B0H13DRAFT_2353758 [Mycena leptocephala]